MKFPSSMLLQNSTLKSIPAFETISLFSTILHSPSILFHIVFPLWSPLHIGQSVELLRICHHVHHYHLKIDKETALAPTQLYVFASLRDLGNRKSGFARFTYGRCGWYTYLRFDWRDTTGICTYLYIE